ncbi:hypothetical protein [Sphingopyxis indica]|uniref:hypothetical protein n=1 Tax=Sphingopyxis indica TaxID=436663 RepID=UPI001131FFED|nr:hypothetical protein [Sphingopyxis indica]
MLDRPPPSRFSVVERGGRLVVIDRESGRTPPSAAERMADHDRRMGLEAARPAMPEPVSETLVVPAPPPRTVAAPAAGLQQAKHEGDAANRGRAARGDRPWGKETTQPESRRAQPAPARIPDRAPPSPGRKTITTAKWWDAKGPRTVQVGPRGQAELNAGLIAFLFMVLAITVVTALIALPLLFVAGFLALRFADKIVAPIGASLIDKALATRE